MSSILAEAARVILPGAGDTESGADLLNVRKIEGDMLILANHVAGVIGVEGTDFADLTESGQETTIGAFLDMLNLAGTSFQLITDLRPINWELRFLPELQALVDATDSEWARARYKKLRAELLKGSIESAIENDVTTLRQYVVVPHYIDHDVYNPPSRGLLFWRKPESRFSQDHLDLALRARRGLDDKIARVIGHLAQIPGMRPHRLTGLELTQLLHLLWRNRAAYDEWITSDAELAEISSTESGALPVITGRRET